MLDPLPTEEAFTIEVRADAHAVKVTFNPTESKYSFTCLDPSEWSQHGLLSDDVRERHGSSGDTGRYAADDVRTMARSLADRELRRANEVPLEGVSATGVVASLGGAPPLPVEISATMGVATEFGATVEARASATQDQNVGVTTNVTRFAFPSEWDAERDEAIRLLASLPQVLQEADQALRLVEEMRRFGVGGNNPPEDIEALPPAEAIITEATVAGDALLSELTADQPHLSSIHLAARALKRVGGWVATMARWVAQKADAFLDEYLKQLAKPAAIATAVGIGVALTRVKIHLDSITTLVSHLLGSLHILL